MPIFGGAKAAKRVKVGVNGFGRIGRLAFRAAWGTCSQDVPSQDVPSRWNMPAQTQGVRTARPGSEARASRRHTADGRAT
jgi:hypothetical protein